MCNSYMFIILLFILLQIQKKTEPRILQKNLANLVPFAGIFKIERVSICGLIFFEFSR